MTRPEISLSILAGVLSRQDGHIPMKPSDMTLMTCALADLRASVAQLRTAASGVPVRTVTVGPFVRTGVVVAFPVGVRS